MGHLLSPHDLRLAAGGRGDGCRGGLRGAGNPLCRRARGLWGTVCHDNVVVLVADLVVPVLMFFGIIFPLFVVLVADHLFLTATSLHRGLDFLLYRHLTLTMDALAFLGRLFVLLFLIFFTYVSWRRRGRRSSLSGGIEREWSRL